ncbi:helix-turn-helix domain-containing protein [Streptomyces sp. NPDC096033]|uniref:helix-turn-helix domain-containing protein n=1 Tax=Streptomyces sp. NPDC096033 TaxID=3366071 RepID=UPI00380E2134
MTAAHMGMVFAAEGLDGPETLLLLAYCNRTDDHGYCWPGQQRLVDDCGTSASTVKRVKASLVKKGLIASIRRVDPKTGEPITNLTRVNLGLLASMKRPAFAYDDNVIEKLTFDEPASAPKPVKKAKKKAETGSDLLMGQDEPDPQTPSDLLLAQDEPDLGPNMDPTPVQDGPLNLSEPSLNPQGVVGGDDRRSSTGSGAPEDQAPQAPQPDRVQRNIDALEAAMVQQRAKVAAVEEQVDLPPAQWPPVEHDGRRWRLAGSEGTGRDTITATSIPVQKDGRTALHELPEDFRLTDAMRREAARTFPTVDVDHETEQFCAHYWAKGDRRRDWPKQWQHWMRNAAKFASERKNRPVGNTRATEAATMPDGTVLTYPSGAPLMGTDAKVGRAMWFAAKHAAEDSARGPEEDRPNPYGWRDASDLPPEEDPWAEYRTAPQIAPAARPALPAAPADDDPFAPDWKATR